MANYLQNSEEDYVEIYSRIHGVSAKQARDEPSHLEKLKMFVAMCNTHKRIPLRIQGNRNPQYSYCTQDEMDNKQSKVPEKMILILL